MLRCIRLVKVVLPIALVLRVSVRGEIQTWGLHSHRKQESCLWFGCQAVGWCWGLEQGMKMRSW